MRDLTPTKISEKMAAKKAAKKQSNKPKGSRGSKDEWEVSSSSNGSSPVFYLGALLILAFAYFTHQQYPVIFNQSIGGPEDLCNCGGGSTLCWQVNASNTGASNKLEVDKIHHASGRVKTNIGIFQMFRFSPLYHPPPPLTPFLVYCVQPINFTI
jgi:hypothetical protein